MRKLVLALATLVLAAPWPSAQTRFVSARFAVRTAGGADALVVFDADGAELRSIALGGRVPVFGPGHVALVAKSALAGSRPVELLDGRGETRASFAVPAEGELVVGADSLALRPASLHRPALPFDVAFLGLTGAPLGERTIADTSLIELRATAHGDWLAFTADPAGLTVHALDPAGRSLWAFGAGTALPAVSLSPSGGRAAIGSPATDLQTSTLSLLDRAGRLTASAEVPAFTLAAFSPDEQRLLLAGDDAFTLVDPVTGDILLSRSGGPAALRGQSLAFSADGRLAFRVARSSRRDGFPASLVLESIDVLGGRPGPTSRALDLELPPDEHAVDLHQTPAGALRLVLTRSVVVVTP